MFVQQLLQLLIEAVRCCDIQAPASPESLRVLVVDDDERVTRLLEANLSRAGYQVKTAPNGADAMRLLLQEPFHLVVADVEMPQLDGLELVALIRADKVLQNLPVVLLSAHDSDDDMMKGLLQGADIYLTKPFHPTELLTAVSRLLSE